MHIERETLESMFSNIASETDWDMQSEMMWSYYFLADQELHLKSIAETLQQDDYEFIEIEPLEEGGFSLTMVRIETHSIDTLHKRCDALEAFALECGAEYDGVDVGPLMEAGCCGCGDESCEQEH